jgi:hypothetical protein
MAVNYYLRENKLTQEENDYMAYVMSARQVDLNQVIERIIEHGSTVNKADIVSVFTDFQDTLQSLLAEGAFITTPFANFSSSIRGVFMGAVDDYDSARHQITVNLNAGAELRRFMRENVSAQKQEPTFTGPKPLQFIDSNTGENNSVVTAGGLGILIGNRLNFDQSDPKQGIYFVSEDGQEFRVEVVGHNRPSNLSFIIPGEITSGDYQLFVRSKAGNLDKEGKLERLLSAA